MLYYRKQLYICLAFDSPRLYSSAEYLFRCSAQPHKCLYLYKGEYVGCCPNQGRSVRFVKGPGANFAPPPKLILCEIYYLFSSFCLHTILTKNKGY